MRKLFDKYRWWFPLLCSAIVFFLCMTSESRAAIVATGDVSPADSATWTAETVGDIGLSSTGQITVDNESELLSKTGYLGKNAGSDGMVTVTGPNSKWTNSGDVFVGYHGNGTLAIKKGAQVSNVICYLTYLDSRSTGTAIVTDIGSRWTISKSLIVGSNGGILNIKAGGQVSSQIGGVGNFASISGAGSKWTSDAIVVGSPKNGTMNIDQGGVVETNDCTVGAAIEAGSNHIGTINVSGAGSKLISSTVAVGLYGSGSLNVFSGGQVYGRGLIESQSGPDAIVTIRGPGSTWYGDMSVGLTGDGELNIEEGGQVNSNFGTMCFLGDYSHHGDNSIGTARIVGAGSKWTIGSDLYMGKAVLRIVAGGQLSNSIGYIGYDYQSTVITVDGIGSQWNNSSNITTGIMNDSKLNITGGGVVTAQNVTTFSTRFALEIDTGTGSVLSIYDGNGVFNFNGTARILAGANPVPNAVYKPILAATWSGTGVFQPVGGTWNSTTHEFTVSDVAPGVSGSPVTVDRLFTQRMLIDDAASTWKLGASFASTTASAPLSLTATAIGDGPLTALKNMLPANDTILGGWNLASASGYTAGDPIYLSFEDTTDGGHSTQNMHVWSYDGTKWSEFTTDDLTYNGNYASFTTTALGCYAVTVPEPGMLVLLTLGAVLLAMGTINSNRHAK
jgi:T5SS/PEP-CTERM-associated repeat protein